MRQRCLKDRETARTFTRESLLQGRIEQDEPCGRGQTALALSETDRKHLDFTDGSMGSESHAGKASSL